MNIYSFIILFLFIALSCKQTDKDSEEKNRIEEEQLLKDTITTSEELEFGFLYKKITTEDLHKIEISDSIRLQKITNHNLKRIDTANWDKRLGDIPYLSATTDELEMVFKHGNFEGEDFYFVSRNNTKDFTWYILGGFNGVNIASYNLLIENRHDNSIVFFMELGYVGFNYEPLIVKEFKNDFLSIIETTCLQPDYDGALGEVEKKQTNINIDLLNKKVKIKRSISKWLRENCN